MATNDITATTVITATIVETTATRATRATAAENSIEDNLFLLGTGALGTLAHNNLLNDIMSSESMPKGKNPD
jgi:hypothetical protein